MNVDDVLKLSLPERVRQLELYGTSHVDSWIEIICKRLDAIERRLAIIEAAQEPIR